MSRLSRAEEDTLKILREKDEKGTICEDEDLVRSMLEDRYSVFLEEGVRKLRDQHGAGSPKRKMSSFLGKLGIGNSSNSSGNGSGANSAGAGGGDEDGDVTLATPTFVACNHWNWVSPELIVGAVPYAGMTQDKAAHLLSLRDQLHKERCALAVVVSCLEDDELVPSQVQDWAQPKDWEQVLQTTTFLNLPLPQECESEISVPFAEMLQICSQVYSTLHPTFHSEDEKELAAQQTQYGDRRAAYVHCKAGRGRSWVVAMCYLTSQEVMPYDQAEAQIKKYRGHMKPTDHQIEYVKEFVEFSAAPIAKKKNEEEEKYFEVLAAILQLQPKYRSRLMKDLAKLT